MPRPVKDDPRDCFKSFRFTQAEITRLEARARAERRTLSAYVRARILELESHPPPSADAPKTSFGVVAEKLNARYASKRQIEALGTATRDRMAARLLAEQIRRIGVNLNQIARRMNEQRIPPPRDMTMLLDEIRTFVREARDP